jgi:hypothetical protein
VHLPYVETVPAVPTGCFVARSNCTIGRCRLIDLGTSRSTDVETTLPAASGGVVSQHGRRNAHCWAGG